MRVVHVDFRVHDYPMNAFFFKHVFSKLEQTDSYSALAVFLLQEINILKGSYSRPIVQVWVHYKNRVAN